MISLPHDINVYSLDDAPKGAAVFLRLSDARGNAMERPMHPWEARNVCKALAMHACDPLTARAVCGLIGGVS